MRKSLKIITGFGWAALVGLAADMVTDTGPLVCKVDPTCRKLTADEIEKARPVFGNQINYENVRLYKRHSAYKPLMEIYFDTASAAQAIKNNIYLPNNNDEVRIHELAHVWQWQKKVASNPLEPRKRDYDLSGTPSFSQFGKEQQAEIIATYSWLALEFTPAAYIAPKFKTSLCPKLRQYEAVVSQALPIKPTAACQKPSLP